MAQPAHPWVCKSCGYIINGGAWFKDGRAHECDLRSVSRYQGARIVSTHEADQLAAWPVLGIGDQT